MPNTIPGNHGFAQNLEDTGVALAFARDAAKVLCGWVSAGTNTPAKTIRDGCGAKGKALHGRDRP
jgi:hypothetical protein